MAGPAGTIAGQLSRYRRLAALGVLPAVLAGLLVAEGTPMGSPATTATASAQVLLRARDIANDDLDPRASDSVAIRAMLVGDLLATADQQARIAGRAGLAPRELTVLAPDAARVGHPVALTIEATTAALPRSPYVLRITGERTVPILTLKATAPSASAALRLVTAAGDGVERLLAEAPRPGSGLVPVALGRPVTEVVRPGTRIAAGLMAAVVALLAWWTAVIVGTGLRDRVRAQYPTAPSVSSQ